MGPTRIDWIVSEDAGPLYVFIDESGNFDFSSGGTDHFLMAAVLAREPIASAAVLQKLKYKLLSEGIDEPVFHASEDKQAIRDRVFEAINSLKSVSGHIVYVNKHRTAPALQNPARMYSLFGGAIAKYLMKAIPKERHEQIILVFDKALPSKSEKAFLAAVKPTLNALKRPYRIYFQSVKYDFNGQIADYLAWAHYVHLERAEHRPLAAICNVYTSAFDLFRMGHTIYY